LAISIRKGLTKVSLNAILFSNERENMKSTIRVIILAICFISLQSLKAATGDITGQIIEKETQAPVAFAEVTLDNGVTKTVIHANEYGHYSANHLPVGKYNVTVKYDNHTVAMNAVHIKDSYTIGINLVVSGNSTVEAAPVKKTNEVHFNKGTTQPNSDLPVNPTQGPVKAPLV
jgi:hypothetical protein